VDADWVLGVVCSVGKHTKVAFVEPGAPEKELKLGSINKTINTQIVILVSCLICVCTTGAIMFELWSAYYTDHWYLHITSRQRGVGPGLKKFFTFFLLNYQFIPVSLYVSMAGVYTLQAFFMSNDVQMYDDENDEPMQVRTMSLNDEIGQITHIFSDKTGTLTRNLMEARKVYINGAVSAKVSLRSA
jgi:magnesium-transporting ATPase (P-type)